MEIKTKSGAVVANFEAVSKVGYPGKSRTLHWNVRCRRCSSSYVVRGEAFRSGDLKCDLCDYPRFEKLTTEEEVLTKNRHQIREYKKWLDMKNRCLNRDHYRDRSIQVSPLWVSDFVQFFCDCGPQPGPDFVLDRYPDGAGNYEPGNVRWATPRQSNENRTWAVKPPATLNR